MRYTLAAVCLFGCYDMPVPVCVTSCGLQLIAGDASDCEPLQGEEDGFVAATRPYVFQTKRHKDVCQTLNGFSVRVIESGDGGFQSWGRRVAGVTYCEYAAIFVARRDTWRATALRHELLHALECPEPDDTHVSWSWQWGVQ